MEKEEKDNFKKMTEEIAEYIKSKGGNVIMMSNIRIIQRSLNKHNFTFKIDFTGKAPV